MGKKRNVKQTGQPAQKRAPTEAQKARRRRQRQRRRERKRSGQARPGPGQGSAIVGEGAYSLKGKFAPFDWLQLEGEYSSDPIVGSGAYSIKKNSLVRSKRIRAGLDPPKVENIGNGEIVVVQHREYLGDLLAGPAGENATQFDLVSFAINPGNSEWHPWGSTVAPSFQEYEYSGLVVVLKPLVADFSSEITIGAVFAATDYNPLANSPDSKRDLENMQYADSRKPSEPLTHLIECSPRLNAETHLLVTTYNNYFGTDPRNFDMGRFHVGSEGLPNSAAGIPLCEVWVTYEIMLFKPKLPGVPAGIPAFGILTGPCNDTATLGKTDEADYYQTPLSIGNSPDFSIISGYGPGDEKLDTVVFPTFEGTYLVTLLYFTTGTGDAAYLNFFFNGPCTIIQGGFPYKPGLSLSQWDAIDDTGGVPITDTTHLFVNVSALEGVVTPAKPTMTVAVDNFQSSWAYCMLFIVPVPWVPQPNFEGWIPPPSKVRQAAIPRKKFALPIRLRPGKEPKKLEDETPQSCTSIHPAPTLLRQQRKGWVRSGTGQVRK